MSGGQVGRQRLVKLALRFEDELADFACRAEAASAVAGSRNCMNGRSTICSVADKPRATSEA